MSVSRPVVKRPASVTDWTCEKGPYEGATHHLQFLGGVVRCAYCGESARALRNWQEAHA